MGIARQARIRRQVRSSAQLRTGPVLAVAALLLTACGGSAGTAGADATATGGSKDDARSAQLAFAKCMREQGVDVPDPKAGSDGGGMVRIGPGDGTAPDQKKFAAAHAACKKHLPDACGSGPGGLSEQDKRRMVQFAQCMRKHGVDMPDPDFSKGNGTMTLGRPDDAKFKAAHEACKQYFGPAGGGS